MYAGFVIVQRCSRLQHRGIELELIQDTGRDAVDGGSSIMAIYKIGQATSPFRRPAENIYLRFKLAEVS